MIIKRMHASFGRLLGEELDLKAGLNVIERPNESGKSTWCAFLLAMLYGVNTAERDRQGYLTDKTRFRPWSGAPMEGSIDLSLSGRDITIERKAHRGIPMRDFAAVFTGTGEAVPGLTSENAGEMLTGVGKSVFERTAFIRQDGVRVGQTPELERRIAALVSSGEETVSFTEADGTLRAWQRKLRYNRSGSIPALQAKLLEARENLRAVETSCEEAAAIRDRGLQLREERELLSDELRAHRAIEADEKLRRIAEARAEAEKAEAEANEAKARLRAYNCTDDGHIAALRDAMSSADARRELAEAGHRRFDAALSDCEKAETALRGSRFAGKTGAAVMTDASSAERLEARAREAKKKLTIPAAAAAVLCVLFAVLAFALSGTARTVIFSAAAIICAAAAAAAVIAVKDRERTLSRLLSDCGVSSASELRTEADRHSALVSGAEAAKAALESARASVSEADSMLAKAGDAVFAAAWEIDPHISSREEIPAMLAELEELKADYRRLSADADAKRQISAALEQSQEHESPAAAFADLPKPRFGREETEDKLDRVTASLENATTQYNLARGRMRALGDPIVLSGEINELTEELAGQTARYDSLELAISALREANADIQNRFSPLLGRAAGAIFSKLTGGRYDTLNFDRALDAYARARGETVSRNVLALSAGTADQIYLSLRLAACEVVLPQEDPCPVILDDALVSFDDNRAGLALDCLKELSRTRQVILFTCQGREASHFAEDPEVNVIR